MGVVSGNDVTCRRDPSELGRLGNDLAVIVLVVVRVVRCPGSVAAVCVTARREIQHRHTGTEHNQSCDQPSAGNDPAWRYAVSAGTSSPSTATTTNGHVRHPNTATANTRPGYVARPGVIGTGNTAAARHQGRPLCACLRLNADVDGGRSAGRPRDASIDERVLAVTRELLVELGWDELSMRLIAARAGVSRSSLARRWTSKAELVLHAILGATPDLAPFAGTDRAGWVDWVVRGSRQLFARAEVKAAVPGLLLAMAENPELRGRLWSDFSGPAVALFAGADGGDAERDARAALAMAAGAAMFLTTIAVEDDTEALQARIVDILTAAVVRPATT